MRPDSKEDGRAAAALPPRPHDPPRARSDRRRALLLDALPLGLRVVERVCDSCGSRYEALRSSSRYCSGKCRKRAQRSGVAKPAAERPTPRPESAVPPPPRAGEVTAAVLTELQEAKREQSALGRACLALAHRIDFGTAESGSALAALTRELRAALEAALEKTEPAGDALDEVARQRAERIARAARGG